MRVNYQMQYYDVIKNPRQQIIVNITRGQAVARIADHTASQQTVLISDCC